jgi:hypothetical protein
LPSSPLPLGRVTHRILFIIGRAENAAFLSYAPRSRVVGHFGWQPAARSLIAALRELDVGGTNLAIPRLRTEGE